jgi:hypothetical protein
MPKKKTIELGEDAVTSVAQQAQAQYNKMSDAERRVIFENSILKDAQAFMETKTEEKKEFDFTGIDKSIIQKIHDKYSLEYVEKLIFAGIVKPDNIKLNKEFLKEFLDAYANGKTDEGMRANIYETYNQMQTMAFQIESDEVYAIQSKKVVEALKPYL